MHTISTQRQHQAAIISNIQGVFLYCTDKVLLCLYLNESEHYFVVKVCDIGFLAVYIILITVCMFFA